MSVPNLFPTFPSSSRLAIIGEAPGKEEVERGVPFVGGSGRLLASLLSNAGMARASCFFGNVCQHQPFKNDISLFHWDGPEIQQGLQQLTADIEKFNPNCVLLLGNVALKAAKDPRSIHPLTPNRYRYKNAAWRGSFFIGDGPFAGRKCIATFHPAYCLRDYACTPFLLFDICKAVRESSRPELVLPAREIEIETKDHTKILARLREIREAKRLISSDIEGGVNSLSCISFATSPQFAFIVPFIRKDGSHIWSLEVERELYLAVCNVLSDPFVPKVFQYGLYDTFVLQHSYHICVRNFCEDTLLKHWELYSELAKDDDKNKKTAKKGMGLAVQASIYTDEPYYKGDRKSQDDHTFFSYCCRDSLVTYEICEHIQKVFDGDGGNGIYKSDLALMREHYAFNISLLPIFRFLSIHGIRYDSATAKTRRDILATAKAAAQAKLNAITGHGFSWTSRAEIFNRARDLMGKKKGEFHTLADIPPNAYKDYQASAARLVELFQQKHPSLATIGEIEDLCEVSLNTDSTKQFIPFLYETLKLPVQYKEDKEKREFRPTADYEALIKLARILAETPSDPRIAVVNAAIELRALSTRRQMLEIKADSDGRIRCAYNPVGSSTGRVSSSVSPTGSGYNLQTIPNYTDVANAPGGLLGDRDLFLADPGYYFFQCDLAGADGWTVAAYAAMLGDDNMLADYRAGLKPANILTLILRGLATERTDRDTLKALKSKVSGDSWDYFAMKRVQHGASYLEGDLTISRNIHKDSEGKFFLSEIECGKLKRAFFTRYRGIPLWHSWVARRLSERPVLIAASGQVRQFLGRRDEILTKAVAFEPQANTTYATNLAIRKLWTDPENRQSPENRTGEVWLGGSAYSHETPRRACNGDPTRLRIIPLHQVHDAVCGQFRIEDTTWATARIKSYFNNPLKIAGTILTIPYEGGYGVSWADTKDPRRKL